MTCPDDSAIADFLEGTLDARRDADVKAHIAACDDCRALVGATARSIGSTQTGGGVEQPHPTSPAKQVIGRYEIRGILGAGAMGVVYAAYDPQLDRTIALKLLRADADGEEGAEALQKRLASEAKAMARLSHENVVMVHDAGIVDGRGFAAMELVDGMSLSAWLKAATRTWGEVLALYLGAGRGLAAAHRAGLVHRDFKPENVLVGKDGRPRVTDFGLARSILAPRPSMMHLPEPAPSLPAIRLAGHPLAADETVGIMAGTPAYMSPEQLAGRRADARSDQFSFCVALYEGLYGERPFPARSIDDALRAVSAAELPPPPKGSRVPAWLRRVLVRGLRAEPAERYPSMEPLLAALEKQAWRIRRRVLIVLGIAAAFVAGLTGYRQAARDRVMVCGGGEVKLRGVWDAQRKRDVERAFEATGAPYAHDSWVKTATQLDDYVARWGKQYTDACEATHVRGEQSAELLDLRQQCLGDRLTKVVALTQVLAGADKTVVENSIGAIHELPSLDLCANAAALRASVKPPPDTATAKRVADLRAQIASAAALEDAGKYAQALGISEATVGVARSMQYLPIEAEALYELGVIQGRLDKLKLAEATLEEAAAVAEAGSHHRVAALAWIDLVYFVGFGEARFDQAHRWLRYAGVAIERMGGDDELEAERLEKLGVLEASEDKNADALVSLRKARALFEEKAGPSNLAVAKTLDAIAGVEFNEGHFEEALRLRQQAVDIDERAYGPRHPNVGVLLNNLGLSLWRLGRYDEALAAIERSLDISTRVVGPDLGGADTVLDSKGSVLNSMHRYDEAEAALKHAQELMEASGRQESTDYGSVLNDLGEAALGTGHTTQALGFHRRALAILEKALGSHHPDVVTTHYLIAQVLLAQRKLKEAVDEDTAVLAVLEVPGASPTLLTAQVLTATGEGLLGLKDPARAQPLLERAVDIYARMPGEAADWARATFALARARRAMGDEDAALALARSARDRYSAAGYFKKEATAVGEWMTGHAVK